MALEAVQAQAGHASIESTRIYLHLADDWLASQYRRAAEAIDAQLLPGKPCRRRSSVRRMAAVSGPRRLPDLGPARAAASRTWSATMRRYLRAVGLRRCGPAASAAPTWPCGRSPRSWSSRHPRSPAVADVSRRPHRGLQALAGRPARPAQPAAHPGHPARTGWARCGCSSSASSEWGWPDAPARVPILPGDLPRQDHPLPKALDDPAAAKLLRAAQNHPACWSGSSWKCCCAPDYGSASSPPCQPTRSCSSAPRTGCTSRSASCTTTATCRCTRTWSP